MTRTTLLALAERATVRAMELSHEADIGEIELAALHAVEGAECARWEADKTPASMFRFRQFRDRIDMHRRTQKMTREDIAHYEECAASLRAIAGSMTDD